MHVVFLVCSLIFAMFGSARPVSPVPSVPDRVQALVGSCVVVPCSFPPPAAPPSGRRREKVDVRVRVKSGGYFMPLTSTAFNSEQKDRVSRDFLGRASLFGSIANGDCSVKIERISQDDSRMFEVALKGGGDLLWGKPKTFNLDVVETPEAPVISGTLSATEGQRVALNCSVSYHCPTTPPALRWTLERGAKLNGAEHGEVQTLKPEPHRLMLLAPLSFTASHQPKPRLRCEASFPGARPLSTSEDLHVTFSPKDVRVQVQTLAVVEGGTALLVCSCKADPPAAAYRWSYTDRNRTVDLRQHTHAVRLHNVTRGMRVRCSAQNLVGRGESKPTSLNIQYKPAILRLSSVCALEGTEVRCHCFVDSNPRAAVTWSVNGTVPPPDYNVSVTSEPHAVKASLNGRMDKRLVVICFAFNAWGNDSLLLLQREEEAPLVWLLIPAVAICLLIFLLALISYCCRRRAQKHVLRRPPAVYPEDLGIYQDRMPMYINCTEVTHIYTNGSYQLVYQNCTPLFVRNSQIRPIGRRGGERKRRGEGGGGRALGVRGIREVQSPAGADAETGIYLEVL
ncbi:B-cell receptor CD22 [Betta splendens]|uniref:B-cell receptor CD22 n=1 Tax=Betta splendens TaxID=158456 RepID=A0A6P7KW45_BETSP|nr:B-cell receptor CD22 [Betta splendens]